MLTRTQHRLAAIASAAVLAGSLAGCTGSQSTPVTAPSSPASSTGTAGQSLAPEPAPQSSAPQTPPASSPSDGATSGAGSCGPSSGRAAAAKGIASLALPSGLPDATWDAANADYSTYQPCSALSWVTLGLTGATASSPYAILLFHDGEYLGTATKAAYSFHPDVARTGGSSLAVTYHYAKPGESDADRSGTTRATLTWSSAAQKVQFSGQTPPVG
ncbi:LppP/LprE family lipoprotein [Frondihabitans peucedani]|uniref:LppP/LprE lipoprotein n=1 Tax=Frondihabitans peucedani TaxID=598626 RepID=A0ABP8E4D6_9MICO